MTIVIFPKETIITNWSKYTKQYQYKKIFITKKLKNITYNQRNIENDQH